jgi:hypothetical protein
MTRRKSAGRAANKGGMAFGRNLMVLGAVIFGIGGYATFMGAMTLKWPRAAATITSAALLRQSMPTTRRSGGVQEDSWNSFHVLFRYSVADREYVAGGVEPYDLGMQNSAGAAKMRERHPVGTTAAVAYDPGNPAVAYLEPGPSSFALALTGIGSFMVLVGFWVRRKAAAGIGAMNEEGATERATKALDDGDAV